MLERGIFISSHTVKHVTFIHIILDSRAFKYPTFEVFTTSVLPSPTLGVLTQVSFNHVVFTKTNLPHIKSRVIDRRLEEDHNRGYDSCSCSKPYEQPHRFCISFHSSKPVYPHFYPTTINDRFPGPGPHNITRSDTSPNPSVSEP